MAKTTESSSVHRLRADQGFGLIEIVVSMFILALLAIAFAPVLITSLQTTSLNATRATATQLVNERAQLAQASGPSCSAVASLGGTQSLTDARGVAISVTTTVAECPTGIGTVRVSAEATRDDTGAVLANVATLVFVE